MRYIDVFCRRRTILAVFLWLLAVCASAQYDPSFSHYFDMEPSFNAAAVGKDSKINVTAGYAMAMAGFENNPQTMYLAADMPFFFLNQYHGAGIQFMNDKIGAFTHQKLGLQYAFRHKLFGGRLAWGLSAGLLSESIDPSKIDLDDSSDNAFPTSEADGNALDLGVGLYYQRGLWYVGISAQHLTAPTVELGERNELQIDPTYYLTGGYNIRLRNPFLTIKPSFLVRSDGTTWRGDISTRLVYTNDKKQMYAGVAYSPTNSVTVLLGGMFHGINLGYSYEVYTSAISPGNGSHELFVGYQIDINLIKKGKNMHKSVRIL
ncbi:MAG: type IX secretion system membrane protein PorP/SprF [Prevotella sp.]|nr:type IX secretion system membrane protein PorP/SprF [Prevotella sp.]